MYLFAVYRKAPSACELFCDLSARTLFVTMLDMSGIVTLPGCRIAAESAVFVE